MDFSFSTGMMTWDNAEVPMKDIDSFLAENIDQSELESMFMHDPDTTEVERIQYTLDAKYSPADLNAEVDKCKAVDAEDRGKLLKLLKKYETLFDGTLGEWKTDAIEIELKPDAIPHY